MARRRTSTNKGQKARTGGKPWTTDRQREWLMGLRDLHHEAQRSKERGAIKSFLRKVLDDFVSEFWKDKRMTDEARKSALELLNKVT